MDLSLADALNWVDEIDIKMDGDLTNLSQTAGAKENIKILNN